PPRERSRRWAWRWRTACGLSPSRRLLARQLVCVFASEILLVLSHIRSRPRQGRRRSCVLAHRPWPQPGRFAHDCRRMPAGCSLRLLAVQARFAATPQTLRRTNSPSSGRNPRTGRRGETRHSCGFGSEMSPEHESHSPAAARATLLLPLFCWLRRLAGWASAGARRRSVGLDLRLRRLLRELRLQRRRLGMHGLPAVFVEPPHVVGQRPETALALRGLLRMKDVGLERGHGSPFG